MRYLICILLIYICHTISSHGQHIFLPTVERKQLVDSLYQQIKSLNNEHAHFYHDTALFYTIDRYYYHISQLNPGYAPTVDLQRMYADSMFQLAKRNHWRVGLAIATVRQARAALNYRQDSTALQLFQRAAYLCAQEHLDNEQGMALIHLASCLAYRPKVNSIEWQQTVSYMKQALHVAKRANDAEIVFQYYNFMGDFHVIRGEYGAALQYFNAAIPVLKENPHLSGNRTNLAYRGICHLHLGHIDDASQLINRFFEQSNPDEGTYATYLHHIILYEISQYYVKKHQYETALRYLRQYARILPQRPPIDHYKYHKTLVEVYEQMGNYKLALWHQRQFQTARDTIRSEEFSQQFASLEASYQLTRKENKIHALENQSLEHINKIQQTRLWLLVISLLFTLSLLGLMLYLHRLRQRKIQSDLQVAEIQNEANKKILDAQDSERERMAADLHDDLGGLIATIGHQLDQSLHLNSVNELQQRIQIIKETTSQAGDKVRTIAHNLMPPDFERLGLSESIQQLILSLNDNRFSYVVYGIPRRLVPPIELNAYRILSELIHNVQKHAQAQHVSIQLFYHSDSLSIVVDDDGMGNRATKNTSQRVGIGLKNISSRVNYLHARWQVDATEQGTTTLVDIPYDFVPGQHSDR